MQLAVLLEGINVTISSKQLCRQLSDVQIHEEFGSGSELLFFQWAPACLYYKELVKN